MLSPASLRSLLDRRGEVKGLQSCCLLAVLLYNVNIELLPGGFLAVDVFFVLSGYALGLQLLVSSRLSAIRDRKTAAAAQQRPAVGVQFVKVALKKLLGLLVVLLPFMAATAAWLLFVRLPVLAQLAGASAADADRYLLDPLPSHWLAELRDDAVSALAFVQNWRFADAAAAALQLPPAAAPHFGLHTAGGGPVTANLLYKHLWPFAVDAQCSLLATLAFLVCALVFSSSPDHDAEQQSPSSSSSSSSSSDEDSRQHRALLVVFSCAAAASALHMTSLDGYAAFWSSAARVHEFALGCVAAVLTLRQWSASNRRLALAVNIASHFAALLLLLCFVSVREDKLFYYRGGSVLVSLLTLVLLVGLSTPSSTLFPLNWFLFSRPLRWLGKLALTVYLWHWALLVWLTALPRQSAAAAGTPLLCCLLAVVVAALQQQLTRFVRHHGRRVPTPAKLAAAALVVLLLVAALLCVTAPQRVPPVLTDTDAYAGDGAKTVAIVGDDLARSLVPGMLRLADALRRDNAELQLRIVDATAPGLAVGGFLHGRRPLRVDGEPATLHQAVDALQPLSAVVASRPDVVWALSSRDYRQPRLERDGSTLPAGDVGLAAADQRLYDDWEQAVLDPPARTHLYYASVPPFLRQDAADYTAFLHGRARASDAVFVQRFAELLCPASSSACPISPPGLDPLLYGDHAAVLGTAGQAEWLARRIIEQIAASEHWPRIGRHPFLDQDDEQQPAATSKFCIWTVVALCIVAFLVFYLYTKTSRSK